MSLTELTEAQRFLLEFPRGKFQLKCYPARAGSLLKEALLFTRENIIQPKADGFWFDSFSQRIKQFSFSASASLATGSRGREKKIC